MKHRIESRSGGGHIGYNYAVICEQFAEYVFLKPRFAFLSETSNNLSKQSVNLARVVFENIDNQCEGYCPCESFSIRNILLL